MVELGKAVEISETAREMLCCKENKDYEALIDKKILTKAVEGCYFAYVEKFSEVYFDQIREDWKRSEEGRPLRTVMEELDESVVEDIISKYLDNGYEIEESKYGYVLRWRRDPV